MTKTTKLQLNYSQLDDLEFAVIAYKMQMVKLQGELDTEDFPEHYFDKKLESYNSLETLITEAKSKVQH